jgi:hypothetical protein
MLDLFVTPTNVNRVHVKVIKYFIAAVQLGLERLLPIESMKSSLISV